MWAQIIMEMPGKWLGSARSGWLMRAALVNRATLPALLVVYNRHALPHLSTQFAMKKDNHSNTFFKGLTVYLLIQSNPIHSFRCGFRIQRFVQQWRQYFLMPYSRRGWFRTPSVDRGAPFEETWGKCYCREHGTTSTLGRSVFTVSDFLGGGFNPY